MHVFPCHRATMAGCSCGNPDCGSPGKHPRTGHGFLDATTDLQQITDWWTQWPDANIGVATGASDLVVIDIDPRHGGDKTWAALIGELGPEIENTARVLTPQGGRHLYYRTPAGAVIKSAVLGPGVEVKAEGAYVIVWGRTPHGVYRHDPASQKKIAPLHESLAQKLVTPPKKEAVPPADRIPEGQRNTTLFSMGCAMRRKGFTQEAIETALLVQNAACCEVPLDEAEVRRIAASAARYTPGLPPLASWPILPREALYGLAGDVVRTIAPHTEADPVALLLQFLIAFGNAVGRGPYFQVEATPHHLNEFAVIVGNTSRARKGTSWDHIKRLIEFAAADWAKARIQSGLSTGEGLVHAVRDERWDRDKKGDEYLADSGVKDKRLLAQESEFSRPLRVMGREGNTLSELIRLAWDTGNLQIITKTTPARATGAHISIISHITRPELQRRLSNTDTLSGFANRFLFALAQRSRFLPDGGSLSAEALALLKANLAEAVAFVSTVRELKRDAKAHDLWVEVYDALTADVPGLFGATISRAEAHVVRLSAIYAVLDKSAVIQLPHLLAALAVWDYCAASAAVIFGATLGDKTADRILADLWRRPAGMTRTELRDLFHRHMPEEEITRALRLLADGGLAESRQEQTEGRTAEKWVATPSVASVARSLVALAKDFINKKGWEKDLVPPDPTTTPPGTPPDRPAPAAGQGTGDIATKATEAPTSNDRDLGTEGTEASPFGGEDDSTANDHTATTGWTPLPNLDLQGKIVFLEAAKGSFFYSYMDRFFDKPQEEQLAGDIHYSKGPWEEWPEQVPAPERYLFKYDRLRTALIMRALKCCGVRPVRKMDPDIIVDDDNYIYVSFKYRRADVLGALDALRASQEQTERRPGGEVEG